MMAPSDVLLKVEDLKLDLPLQQGAWQTGAVRLVDGVSFEVRRGETLALVGESGCGKSALGRTILQLYRPTSGRVLWQGQDLVTLRGEALRQVRRQMQMLFQDTLAALNPNLTVGGLVVEALDAQSRARGPERAEIVAQLLGAVGLNLFHGGRYAREFSAAQRQRISLARALTVRPTLVICDDPLSGLDQSIQLSLLQLLNEMKQTHGLTYLLLARELGLVRHAADRVGVMYAGRLMELAERDELYNNPLHPYTQALLSLAPSNNKHARSISPSAVGCPFAARCPIVVDQCRQQTPEWREVKPGHWVYCHRV
jgi:oligopeptide/dipeptide ABC transporter ATP-binding protein